MRVSDGSAAVFLKCFLSPGNIGFQKMLTKTWIIFLNNPEVFVTINFVTVSEVPENALGYSSILPFK